MYSPDDDFISSCHVKNKIKTLRFFCCFLARRLLYIVLETQAEFSHIKFSSMLKMSELCPHTLRMCFVRFSHWIAIISVYRTNPLPFEWEMQCVMCEVRPDLLNAIRVIFRLQSFNPVYGSSWNIFVSEITEFGVNLWQTGRSWEIVK